MGMSSAYRPCYWRRLGSIRHNTLSTRSSDVSLASSLARCPTSVSFKMTNASPLGYPAYDPEMAASTETLTFSNLYPNRPIRPLPKRRLRERLSPEVAESIRYPPSTRPTSIFYPPYPTDILEEYRGHEPSSAGGPDGDPGDEVRHFVGAGTGRQNGTHLEVTEDRDPRSVLVPRPPPDMSSSYPGSRQQPKTDHTRQTGVVLPPSDLSADGYESFENTNNKKKRKIPTAGDSSLGGSHALSDGGAIPVSAGLATAHMQSDGSPSSPYSGLNGSSVNSKGISGAGRGMFGRSRNGRSPLRTLSNGNNWTDRNPKQRPSRQWGPPSGKLFSARYPPAQSAHFLFHCIWHQSPFPLRKLRSAVITLDSLPVSVFPVLQRVVILHHILPTWCIYVPSYADYTTLRTPLPCAPLLIPKWMCIMHC